MITRKAKIKDLPNVIPLAFDLLKYHKGFDSYFRPSREVKKAYLKFFTKRVRSPKGLLLVAEQKGRIIGYAVGEITLRPPPLKIRRIGAVNDVFVAEGFRKSGVAKSLLKQLFLWFRSKKVTFVELSVHEKNNIGKVFWKKSGFETFLHRQRVKLR